MFQTNSTQTLCVIYTMIPGTGTHETKIYKIIEIRFNNMKPLLLYIFTKLPLKRKKANKIIQIR